MALKISQSIDSEIRGLREGVSGQEAVPSPDPWPKVNRTEELSRLDAAVCARRGAVIIGAAGVGKTTLARMGIEQAVGRGMWVVRVTATQASRQLSFGAVASILPPDPRDGDPSIGDQGQTLRRYLTAVVEAAGSRQLLLFIDDAHLLDDGSAILVHQLAVMRAATVLATVRLGEVAPDPVTALWKDDLAERIDLQPLGEESVEELLVKVLGAPMEGDSLRWLVSHCQGNPMFLRELVTGALEAGQLVGEGGIWRIRGEIHATHRLVDVVTLRLGALSDTERGLLELLVIGEPLVVSCLDRLVEPTTVLTLERRGLITREIDGTQIQLRLAHPMYGDVVRVGISAIREREISRALAESIEAVALPENVLQLAVLRLAGGGGSAELLLAGAIASRHRNDHVLAERLARTAIEQGAGFEARFIAAWAAHANGRSDQAAEELGELASEAACDADRARVALLRLETSFFITGESDFTPLYVAIDNITDQFWLEELRTRIALMKGISGGPRISVEAGSVPSPNTSAQVNIAAIIGQLQMGRLDEARNLLPPCADSCAVPGVDASHAETGLLLSRAVLLICEGQLAEAEEFLSRGFLHRAASAPPQMRAMAASTLALVHIEQGRPMSALHRARETILLSHEHGGIFYGPRAYGTVALALALTGQGRQAAVALETMDRNNHLTNVWLATNILCARGWTAVAEGDVDLARLHFDCAANLGEEVGDLMGAADALHDLARIGCAREAAPRLTALAAQMDGEFVRARAGYAVAVAQRNSDELIKVGQRFEDLGANLYAAESFADASVLLQRAGRSRAGAAEEQKVARLLARCEGASTPPVRWMTARVCLTAAEMQTASLAAAGHSDKEIAHARTVSVRTVQTQLLRAYAKLGVSGRRDLGEALQSSSRPT